MGLGTALAGLASAANAAINAAGITNPGQCAPGNPNSMQIVQIMQQGAPELAIPKFEWLVSSWALPGGDSMPYPPDQYKIITATPTFTATVSGNVVSFTGTIEAGIPVHIGLNNGLYDVCYVPTSEDTFATLSTALAGAIDALDVSGLSGSAGASSVTVTGASAIAAVLASSGTVTMETGRVDQRLQLSIWAGNNTVRQAIEDAIMPAVGNNLIHSILLSDGTTMDCVLGGPTGWSDQSSPNFSLYLSHLIFMCQYPLTQQVTATTIAAGEVTVTNFANLSTTRYTFGV